jgi:hypothetical protein
VLQRNPHPWPVTLPEYREPSGTVHPTVSVEGGAEIDWPIVIGGFEDLTPADTTETPAEAEPVTSAEAASAASAKTAAKASAKAKTSVEGVSA